MDLGATYDHVAVGTRFHVISSPFFARNETRIGIRQTLTIKVLKNWLVNCQIVNQNRKKVSFHIQRSNRKQQKHKNLLPPRKVQPPQNNRRKNEQSQISNHTKHGIHHEQDRFVDAFARNGNVPGRGDRCARKYACEHTGDEVADCNEQRAPPEIGVDL